MSAFIKCYFYMLVEKTVLFDRNHLNRNIPEKYFSFAFHKQFIDFVMLNIPDNSIATFLLNHFLNFVLKLYSGINFPYVMIIHFWFHCVLLQRNNSNRSPWCYTVIADCNVASMLDFYNLLSKISDFFKVRNDWVFVLNSIFLMIFK